MYGGLKKSASRLALVAAAGVLSTNAFAADLGGDCCADLEERVAELEATAARKGTRKTSLEVWGQVNKVIIGWNDGFNHNWALGEDNVNASTRFGFRGSAKWSPTVSSGYSIVVEWATGARSTNVSQFQDKGAGTGIVNPSASSLTGSSTASAAFSVNDPGITMREANWWIESTTVGRLTVGRFINPAGPQGTIDLAGIGLTVASGSVSLLGTGLAFRTNAAPAVVAKAGTGNYSNYNLGNTTDSAGEYSTRENGVSWVSPTLAGFTLAASIAGEVSQDNQCSIGTAAGGCADNYNYGPEWGVALKYANEFGGFRFAAAAGWEESKGEDNTSTVATGTTSYRPDAVNKGLSVSLLHVPTGLFVQGHDNWYVRGHDLYSGSAAVPSIFAANGISSDTANQWLVQAGISKNWFGMGATTLYGEYQKTTNGFNAFGQEGAGSAALPVNIGYTGAPNPYYGDNTTNKMWGLGIQQNIDASAMSIFAGYRDYSLTSGNCASAGGCKDIGVFVTGAKINF